MRNAFKVSRFKTLCWLGLSVTSIPIHLLFNSVIFGTERKYDTESWNVLVTYNAIHPLSYY
jgi:hypothetical protein